MKLIFLTMCILALGTSQVIFGQDISPVSDQSKGYLVGPGDVISGRVLGESQFDFQATVDEDGKFMVPFVEEPLVAKCKNEKQLRAEVTRLLSKYLRNPQISVQIVDRKSRPPAVIQGEVRQPQQVDLRREARLLELISFAGGATAEAGGMVQIFRTHQPLCSEGGNDADWKTTGETGLDIPSRMYSLSSLREGREEANPIIYPGDVIIVQKANPVYITGEVAAPQGIYLKEGGTTLTEAIAMIGGVRREAKTKDIKIYRLKDGSKDREIISVNYDSIKKNEQKDVMLQPYDIIEVDKSKKSIAQVVLELATGVGRTAVGTFGGALPHRILY